MISKAALNWLRNTESVRAKYLEYLELKDRMEALEPAIIGEYNRSRPPAPLPFEESLPWNS